MPLDATLRRTATATRDAIVRGRVDARAFRAALLRVPSSDRDAWCDAVLGVPGVIEDGPTLPRGCTPYLPCDVDALLEALDGARVGPDDVFVDLGAGLGRAAMLAHLLTGAGAIGVEIQRHLAAASRGIARDLGLSRCAVVEGDAARTVRSLHPGTVFFLYCPFGGRRLEGVLAELEVHARARPIRVCTVSLRLPARPWLTRVGPTSGSVAVYRSAPNVDHATA